MSLFTTIDGSALGAWCLACALALGAPPAGAGPAAPDPLHIWVDSVPWRAPLGLKIGWRLGSPGRQMI